jgi:hypothetical protein
MESFLQKIVYLTKMNQSMILSFKGIVDSKLGSKLLLILPRSKKKPMSLEVKTQKNFQIIKSKQMATKVL